jgi:RHS repeat-associated protein
MIKKLSSIVVLFSFFLFFSTSSQATLNGFIPDSTLTGINCSTGTCLQNFKATDMVYGISLSYCDAYDTDGTCIQAHSAPTFSTSQSTLLTMFINNQVQFINNSSVYLTGYDGCITNPDSSMTCNMMAMKQEADPNNPGQTIWVSVVEGNFGDYVQYNGSNFTCPNSGTYVSGQGCTTTNGSQSSTGQPTDRSIPALPSNCKTCSNPSAVPDTSSLSSPVGPNPISLSNSSEIESRLDLSSPMPFLRNYASSRTISSMLGNGWRYAFDKKLTINSSPITGINAGSFVSMLDFNEENDEDIIFSRTNQNNTLSPSFGDQSGYSLIVLPNGYQLNTPNNNVETYNNAGELVSWSNIQGYTLNFTYNNNQVASVTDSYNHSLTFTYTNGLLTHILSDNGDYMDYNYNSGNLISATFNGNETVQYGYTNNLLTSITDENNHLYTMIGYDSQNRANSSQNVLGANNYIHTTNINYGTAGSPVMTQGNGLTSTFSLSPENYQQMANSASISGTNVSTTYGLTYDANSNVNVYTDGNNNNTKTTYNLSNNLTQSVTRADGSTISYTWNSNNRLLSSYTEPSANGTRTVNFFYDTLGNLRQKQVVTSTGTRSWNYTYGTLGRVLTSSDPSGAVTTYTWYADNDTNANQRGLLKTVTNALNQTITINSYDIHGNPVSITDPNGLTKTMTFDSRSRLLTESINGATNTYSYDLAGNLLQVNLANGYILTMTYDNAHRLTQISDNLGASTSYTLDDNDMPTNEQTSQNSTLRSVTNRIFDSLGRLNTLYHTNSAEKMSYTYDANSNMKTFTDTNSNSHTLSYDNLNRLSNMTGSGDSQSYTYDADSNLNQVVANNQTTNYTYDDFAELTKLVSPDSGTQNLTYDVINRKITNTDNLGTVHTYSYDALGRLTSANHVNVNGTTTQAETYSYDTATYGIGFLAGFTDASGNTSYTYDNNENISSKTQTITGTSFTKTVSYGYDSANQLTSVTYPSGLVVTYTYNNGQVSGISLSGEISATVFNQAQYLPFSNTVSQWTWGNNTTLINTYGTDDKLQSIVDGNAINDTFSIDGMGNINSVTDNLNSAFSYSTIYDSDYNLQRFIQNGASDIYGYDTNHNRSYFYNNVSNNPATYNYTIPNTANLLTQYNGGPNSSSPVYYTVVNDANGNMTSDGAGNTYGYDLKNNLTSFSNSSNSFIYSFNARNQRVSKTGNGTTTYFIYDENGNLLAEYDSSGTILAEHIYLNGLPVAVVKNNTLYYVHTDQIGTPRVITDTSNNVVWHWDNVSAFGANPATENGLTNYNLRFSGQYFDKESNLHYNNYRTYNPFLGRYMQSDSVGLVADVNTFRYAGNNSLSNFDTLGLDTLVQLSGNSIQIIVPIGLYSTDSTLNDPNFTDNLNWLANQYKNSLSKYWNSQPWKYHNCNVTFSFPVTVGKSLNNIEIATIDESTKGWRSRVYNHNLNSNTNIVMGNSGKWSLKGNDEVHEVGHLMGLEDRYYSYPDPINPTKVLTHPLPGWNNNIMSDLGPVEQRNIDEIIQNNLTAQQIQGCTCLK